MHRPEAVPWWIKNARRMNKMPPQVDLRSFPAQVREWWAAIQPSWRIPVTSEWPLLRDVPEGEDWSCIKKGGPNGLFLVVMCLYWLHEAAKEGDDNIAQAEYLSIADDISFVFDSMLTCLQLASVRQVSPSSTSSNSIPLKDTLNVTERLPRAQTLNSNTVAMQQVTNKKRRSTGPPSGSKRPTLRPRLSQENQENEVSSPRELRSRF